MLDIANNDNINKEYEQFLCDNAQNITTPCYIVRADKFTGNAAAMEQAFKDVFKDNIIMGYSVKTNHFNGLMGIAKQLGMMAEVVSDDEYAWAQECGFLAADIIYNGPQKTEDKLIDAINTGSIVNIDNFQEIGFIKQNINKVKKDLTNIGLRVNFDLESQCNGETKTGNDVSRFGFCAENGELLRAINELRKLGIRISGLHFHYSTITRSADVFRNISRAAANILNEYSLIDDLRYIDIGGGFFGGQKLEGKPQLIEYAQAVAEYLLDIVMENQVKIIIEPGASIIATAVDYMAQAINVRDIRDNRIITLDGTVSDVNPFMASRKYNYEIMYKKPNNKIIQQQILCGSSCMELDRFDKICTNNEISVGDKVLIHNAGAYTMSFNNCFINRPADIYLWENNELAEVRNRIDNILLY